MEYSEVSRSLSTDLVKSRSYRIIKIGVGTEIYVPFFVSVGLQKAPRVWPDQKTNEIAFDMLNLIEAYCNVGK